MLRTVPPPTTLPGGHEDLQVHRGDRSGHTIIVAVHSSALGPAAGGVRLWRYETWQAAVDDALRLSEAMTHKCALAGLPHGGAKTVIALPPGARIAADERRALFLDLGDVVARLGGRYLAGEDVGTSAADLAIAAERSPDVLCLPEDQGGIGEPAEPTAAGALASLGAAMSHVFGSTSLHGRRIGIHGFGQVGSRIAARAATAGARVVAADVDPVRREVARAAGVEVVDPEGLLTAELDVLVPAALGGFLDVDLAGRLRCKVVLGPANNQLTHPDVADVLHARGVLWAPEGLVGAGGVTYALLRERHGADHGTAMTHVVGLARTVGDALRRAERETTSVAAVCAAMVDERLRAAR